MAAVQRREDDRRFDYLKFQYRHMAHSECKHMDGSSRRQMLHTRGVALSVTLGVANRVHMGREALLWLS